jgi:hypothetical protein
MIRMDQPWVIGIALLATACGTVQPRPGPITPPPRPGGTTIPWSVALRAAGGRCTVETTPADSTRVQKSNNPTLLWQVTLNECKVNARLQIRDWTRYPVLPSGRCDMRSAGIRANPIEPIQQRALGSTQYAARVRMDAAFGCYKYTVFFSRAVQQDPELEIVP